MKGQALGEEGRHAPSASRVSVVPPINQRRRGIALSCLASPYRGDAPGVSRAFTVAGNVTYWMGFVGEVIGFGKR